MTAVSLTPKQEKVVNYLVGQTLKEARAQALNFDPKMVRSKVIDRLEQLTMEESPDDQVNV